MFETLKEFDTTLFLSLNSHYTPWLDVVMFNVSKVWVFFPLFFYWIFLIFKKYGLKKLLILLACIGFLVAVTDQTTNRVKHAVKRYRPTHNTEIGAQVHTVNDYRGGQYGFFSGHSSNTFGVAMFLFLVFSKRSLLFRSQFFIWAAVVAYSRIYLGVHYPSDIFTGFLLGLLLGFCIYQLVHYIFKTKLNEDLAL